MDLIRNIHKTEFEIIGEVYFKLFDRYIKLMFEENIPREYVEKCVIYLNSLDENIISTIFNFSFEFCKDVMMNYDEVEYVNGIAEVVDTKDILKYIEPISLTVDEPENFDILAINIYCKCSWDMNNDMQILIKHNQVVYIGVFDGLNPWQKNLSNWGNYVTGYKL